MARGRDAEPLEERLEARGAGAQIGAEDAAQRGVAAGIAADRPAHHHRQRERAGDAVEQCRLQRDVVGDVVRQRRLGVGEGEAGEQAGARLAGAQIDIAEIVEQTRQRVDDLARGLYREAGRDRIGVDVPDALQRMLRASRPVLRVRPRGSAESISCGSTMAASG